MAENSNIYNALNEAFKLTLDFSIGDVEGFFSAKLGLAIFTTLLIWYIFNINCKQAQAKIIDVSTIEVISNDSDRFVSFNKNSSKKEKIGIR